MALSLEDFSPEDTLVALMISTSVSDETIRTVELMAIERIVNHLPVFGRYDADRITDVANKVYDVLADEDGLDILWNAVRTSLPERLFETAYALCCDVAASDGTIYEGELRFLADMRFELDIDRLVAAAIETGARARHRTLT